MAMTARNFAGMLRSLSGALGADPLDRELEEVSGLFRDVQIENFQNERDSRGNPWAPRQGNYNHPPLRRTLRMFAAATVRGAPHSIEMISRNRMVLGIDGSTLLYPIRHQKGTSRFPARQFFYLAKKDRKRLHPPLYRGQRRVLRTMIKRYQNR